MQQPSAQRYSEHGFTLVELIVVIVITGILAALGGLFIVRPIQGFLDLSRRATLVDAADNALRRMQRDIWQALPNSIRIDAGGQSLELLHTVDGGRYRAQGAVTENVLDFTQADADGFDVLGALADPPTPGDALVIYNLAAAGITGNAYLGDNRRIVTGGTSALVQFNPAGAPFPLSSPFQRFFLVDEPVSYVFNAAAGTLDRYSGYGITVNQNTPPAGARTVMARRVTACNFTYNPGTPQRSGLVTMRLTLASAGETITLLHQVHVENAP